jgi:hypothetical protein
MGKLIKVNFKKKRKPHLRHGRLVTALIWWGVLNTVFLIGLLTIQLFL